MFDQIVSSQIIKKVYRLFGFISCPSEWVFSQRHRNIILSYIDLHYPKLFYTVLFVYNWLFHTYFTSYFILDELNRRVIKIIKFICKLYTRSFENLHDISNVYKIVINKFDLSTTRTQNENNNSKINNNGHEINAD